MPYVRSKKLPKTVFEPILHKKSISGLTLAVSVQKHIFLRNFKVKQTRAHIHHQNTAVPIINLWCSIVSINSSITTAVLSLNQFLTRNPFLRLLWTFVYDNTSFLKKLKLSKPQHISINKTLVYISFVAAVL